MLLFTLRKVQNGKLNISSLLRVNVSSAFINVLAQTESWYQPWQQWPVYHTVHSDKGYCPQTTLPPQTCSTKLPPGWTCHKHTPSGPGSPPIEHTKQNTEINSAYTPLSVSVVLNLIEPNTDQHMMNKLNGAKSERQGNPANIHTPVSGWHCHTPYRRCCWQ